MVFFKFVSIVSLLTITVNMCSKQSTTDSVEGKAPIEITVPSKSSSPSGFIWDEEKISLAKKEIDFSIRCLRRLYTKAGSENFVFSPLSLQYALAMILNGAGGETTEEIAESLGYSSDCRDLNSFMSALLSQLPVIDTTVDLRVVNAMIVNQQFRVQAPFEDLLMSSYFAPVEYVNVSNSAMVVNRINEWASRNTNGFINNLLREEEISPLFVASMLNALYFKAKWSGDSASPMFNPKATRSRPFFLEDGSQVSVDYMQTSKYLRYSQRDLYSVVELPYACGKYVMYILLPVKKGLNSLKAVLDHLTTDEWSDMLSSLSVGPEIHLSVPRSENELRHHLKGLLESIGVHLAFDQNLANFERLIEDGNNGYCIGDVIQKTKISITEWGTEAAAVTAMVLIGDYLPPEHEEVHFNADHPYAYVIAEKESGLILFEGVFTGKV